MNVYILYTYLYIYTYHFIYIYIEIKFIDCIDLRLTYHFMALAAKDHLRAGLLYCRMT